ncbi:MAG: phosphoribosylpyrophosphate synthetase [Daejeonella sp.]
MSASPKNYQNLLEAINDLRNRGYNYDYDYADSQLYCKTISMRFNPLDLRITEYYRFEGMTSPDDNSVLYAIESNDGHRGVLIDAYGAYADEYKSAFLKDIPVVED